MSLQMALYGIHSKGITKEKFIVLTNQTATQDTGKKCEKMSPEVTDIDTDHMILDTKEKRAIQEFQLCISTCRLRIYY